MGKVNLPPFYIGQKVVAVDAHPKSNFKNGTQYTVSAVEYKFGNRDHPFGSVTKYWYGGISGFSDIACFRPGIFAPIEQKDFPAMTFSEIVEKEKIEVLLNN